MKREQLEAAAAQLARSETGRRAMRGLLNFLVDAGGDKLDTFNQDAALTLLAGAWGPFAGSTKDAMREALGGGW